MKPELLHADHRPAAAGPKLRVGVIGTGGMGRAHVAAYQQHPRAEVVAIADPDAGHLHSCGDSFGVERRYAGATELFAGETLDVVSVVTPNAFHKPITLQALAAGCHVLCEKPMAMNTAEARQMVAAAERAGRRLMINFSYRFHPAARAARNQVEAGVLGDIYYARSVWHRRRGIPRLGGWFTTKALSGGGPLIDLGVHRLDLALWLMGHPRPVWAVGSAHDAIGTGIARSTGQTFDVEDIAVGFVKFDNGATLSLEASWAANIGEPELMETRLLGDLGGLVQRNVNGGYDFEAEIHTERAGCPLDTRLHPPVAAVEPSSMAHFVDAILNDTPHMAPGEEGVVVMQVLDAIYKSAREGVPVRIRNGHDTPRTAATRPEPALAEAH